MGAILLGVTGEIRTKFSVIHEKNELGRSYPKVMSTHVKVLEKEAVPDWTTVPDWTEASIKSKRRSNNSS
jgi:hypothetical protein